MLSINLLTHVRSRKKADDETFNQYARIECDNGHKITKSWEEDDLESFCLLFKDEGYRFFDSYFYNFKIRQISKEFDLLRLGKDYIINIELKHESNPERITRQLVQNRYYLSVLQTPIHSFTYIARENQLYYLCGDEIEKADPGILAQLLRAQRIRKIRDLNQLFTPDLFLVSPLLSPMKFLRDEYFLTDQQRMIKTEILSDIDDDRYRFYSISGYYGTGKTLLAYDLAKELMKTHRVGIVHTGVISHKMAVLKQNGYVIIPSSEIDTIDCASFDIIVVDSSQRLDYRQRQRMMKSLRKNGVVGLITYDPHSPDDLKQEFAALEDYGELRSFALTHRIRTNEHMAGFLSALLNKNRDHHIQHYKSVHLASVEDDDQAREMIAYLESQHYYHVSLLFDNETDYDDYEKKIISDEDIAAKAFDRVVITLDHHFYYDEAGRLKANNQRAIRLLEETLERTRFALYVVIINNPLVFSACVSILGEYYE